MSAEAGTAFWAASGYSQGSSLSHKITKLHEARSGSKSYDPFFRSLLGDVDEITTSPASFSQCLGWGPRRPARVAMAYVKGRPAPVMVTGFRSQRLTTERVV